MCIIHKRNRKQRQINLLKLTQRKVENVKQIFQMRYILNNSCAIIVRAELFNKNNMTFPISCSTTQGDISNKTINETNIEDTIINKIRILFQDDCSYCCKKLNIFICLVNFIHLWCIYSCSLCYFIQLVRLQSSE